MKTRSPEAVRKEFAALFLVAVLVAGPAVMLLWGRAGAADGPGAVQEPPSAVAIPPEGARWDVELDENDASHLLGLFLASLSGGEGPGADAAPVCEEPLSAVVFVTVYAEGEAPLRVMAREESLVGSMLSAAGQVVARLGRPPDASALRVRVDVLREARPFAAEQRVTFAHRRFGPTLSAEAALSPDAWREPDRRMWRLDALSFVNDAPGSRYALACPRGLTPTGEPTLARLLRAARLAGEYLVRVQDETGRFLTYWDPVGGLPGGCETVTDQAAAAGALAALADVRRKTEHVRACYDAVSRLMQSTHMDADNPTRAFTRRQEACRLAYELEASAHVLEALCRYRHVARRTEPDAWIAALAEFLLFMQRDDGLFELQYDADRGARTTPPDWLDRPEPQAKAALALALA
ncbi:MAG: hypothetical protein AMK73_05460, partial [Planctomycetes bacterium SM23_32]